ncbi:MAG: DUF4339 domain-containing protein [Fimbriimonadaceae bacterium]|nr:DUF4339 domain-containing protein [Fimbriimonadaceae bacterium]
MRYYVIAPDGQRYGPADVSVLNQWVAEGRLAADSEVEREGDGERMTLSRVEGVALAAQAPMAAPAIPQPPHAPSQPYQQPQNWQQPPGYSNYPRPGQGSPAAGQGELTASWILGAVTFAFCCPVLPIVGLVMANKAMTMGNPSANSARTFNIVVMCLSGAVYLFYIVLFGIGIIASGR